MISSCSLTFVGDNFLRLTSDWEKMSEKKEVCKCFTSHAYSNISWKFMKICPFYLLHLSTHRVNVCLLLLFCEYKVVNHLYYQNLWCQISVHPQCFLIYMVLSCRGLGPWGPNLVRKYTSARFGSYASGELLNEEESKLLTGNPIDNLL